MFGALRIRDFRLLWSARLVSMLGMWLLAVAVPAHVYTLTGSVAAAGLTLAAQFVPPLLLGPFAGVLADRVDRRHVMVTAELVRAAAVAVLLLVDHPRDVWLVYLALLAESVGTVVFRPAASANTPAVVGTGRPLASATALNAGADGMVRLIGAPLGGFLYAWGGVTVVAWLNISTYVLSAAAILLTRPTAFQPGRTAPSLRSGFAVVRALPPVRALLLVNVLFLAANASLSALLVPYGMTVLGGSRQTGLLMSALGVGFLLGAPLRPLLDRFRPSRLLAAALTGTALGYVLLFTSPTLAAAMPAAALIGVAGSTALATIHTTLLRVTPNAVLGRASATLMTGEALATLLGALAGPALAQHLSITATAATAAAMTVASAASALRLLRGTPTHPRPTLPPPTTATHPQPTLRPPPTATHPQPTLPPPANQPANPPSPSAPTV